jgi:hypothetical protein
MLEHAFSHHDVSKFPNTEIFGHFKDYRPSIGQASFSTAMDDETTAAMVAPWNDTVIAFASTQLGEFQPRDEYRELLELTVIFLVANPARWMARAIYSIKMWLFRA